MVFSILVLVDVLRCVFFLVTFAIVLEGSVVVVGLDVVGTMKKVCDIKDDRNKFLCAMFLHAIYLHQYCSPGNPSVLGSVALSRATPMDESVTELLISVLTVETKEVKFVAFTIPMTKSSSVDVMVTTTMMVIAGSNCWIDSL